MEVRDEIDFARLAGAVPRVHGNGFIQLDLAYDRRLHFWGHPAIPRQRVRTPIHDHTFSFNSTVLQGRLFNIRYSNNTPPYNRRSVAYKVYSPNEVGALEYTRDLVAVWPEEVQLVITGEVYAETAFDFHETTTDVPSVTLMVKTGKVSSSIRSRILVPMDLEPDNEFDGTSYIPSFLWNLIGEIVNG